MKKLAKLLWAGLFLMCSVATSAADFSLNPARDFGAIRRIDPTDYDGLAVVRETGAGLSSDTSEAFRNALEVFSKIHVQANYVATSTLSSHVSDNSDVHGCTAIASASAVADALSAANASDALCLRLDGLRAMTGNLRLGGKWLSNDGGNEGLQVSDGGNVLINTTTDDGVNKLQVNGGIYCVSSFIQPSGGSGGTTEIKTGVVSLTVNATTTLSLADGMYPGMIMFYEGNNGKSSIYYFDRQDAQTIEQMDVSGRYSPTKDNASTINLYFYSSVLTLQNKTASTAKIRYSIFGLIP